MKRRHTALVLELPEVNVGTMGRRREAEQKVATDLFAVDSTKRMTDGHVVLGNTCMWCLR